VLKNKQSQLADLALLGKNLGSSLCTIRDMFPVPPHPGVLRDLYIDALADPQAVPAYVKAHLQAGSDAENIRRDGGLRRAMPLPVNDEFVLLDGKQAS
jgi:hypothetical protein